MRRCLPWSRDAARPFMLGAALWVASGGACGQAVPRALSADALASLTPPAAAMGIRSLNPTPCYAIQSSLNTIGSSFAPLTGCPGYSNSP